jgi:hypothetical protein
MDLAPIFVAACRRPSHFRELIQSVLANPEASDSELTIVLGGPKNESDLNLVLECLAYAKTIKGFKNVKIYEEFSLKTGNALIQFCLEKAFETNEKVIILEDDLKVQDNFLSYMNKALNFYASDENVVQISGWNFGIIDENDSSSTHFFPYTTSWGWATWKRSWEIVSDFEANYQWLIQKHHRIKEFNYAGNYNCVGMIEAIKKFDYDAWDVLWYLQAFRYNKISVYPNSSLVINQGFDASGLNFRKSFYWGQEFLELPTGHFEFNKYQSISPYTKKFMELQKKWICASYGWSRGQLYLDSLKRNVEQHFRYYKRGYYARKDSV